MRCKTRAWVRTMDVAYITYVCMTALLSLLVLASPALSGRNPDAMVAVHVLPHDDSRTCGVNFPAIDKYADIAYTYVGRGGVDVFPVFHEITECHGVTYGLTWPGASSCVFTSCSDYTIGDIIWAGDGVAHTWWGCRAGPTIIPGFGRIDVYEPGHVCVVPWAWNGYMELYILDCHEAVDEPTRNYYAGVGGAPGIEPRWGYGGLLRLNTSEGACPDCVEPGDTLVYTLTYENEEGCTALGVSVVDHLALETEYVSSSPAGTYEAESHTVTWYVGEVPEYQGGSIELRARLKPNSPAAGTVLNLCEIWSNGLLEFMEYAVWDSTQICPASTAPTTWSKIKSMFR